MQPLRPTRSAFAGRQRLPLHKSDLLADAFVAGGRGKYIEGEFTVPGALDGLGELRFVGGEDADAFAPARNGDVPLLGVCGGAGSGVGKEDVLHSLALRAVGRDFT